MATTQVLREKVHNLKTQMRDLVKRAEDESREMTADELQQFDEMSADQDKADRELNARLLVLEQKQKEFEAEGEKAPKDEKKSEKELYLDAWHKYMSASRRSDLSQKDFQILQRGTNPLGTGTDALGGYTVPETYSTQLIEKMKWYGGMLEVSNIITTNSGETMYFADIDDTSGGGGLLTEGSAAPIADTTFGQTQLDSYMYTSGIVKMSIQLIQDNITNLQSELDRIIPKRLGRHFNAAATTGTGSSQPNGVVTATSKGADAAAVGTINRTDLLNLQHSIDKAYRNGGRYMFSDATLKAIKLLSIGSSDDRPLWVPSMRDGEPSTIEGYAYTINEDMADIGASAKSVLFGDFSKFYIRLVRGLAVARFDELYMANLQVGFLFYQRFDSELLDSNAIKHLLHPAS